MILSILGQVSARFGISDADKNETYYNSLTAVIQQMEADGKAEEEINDKKSFQNSGLGQVQDKRETVNSIFTASGIFFTAAIILFLVAYRSRVMRRKRLVEIKEEIKNEFRQRGEDLNREQTKGQCDFRLFEEGESTELILQDEEGSTLIFYLIGLLLQKAQVTKQSTSSGNEPLEELIQNFSDRIMMDVNLDKAVFSKIDFD